MTQDVNDPASEVQLHCTLTSSKGVVCCWDMKGHNIFYLQANIPSRVKVGYLNVAVEPHIPNSMRCFKCQQCRHTKSHYKRDALCPKCCIKEHEDAYQSPIKCLNYSRDHPAYSKVLHQVDQGERHADHEILKKPFL